LYIDILGFKKLIKEKNIEDIYKTVDEALKAYYELEKDGFIGFSIVLYSKILV
jgi:hypothetical protein